MLYFSYLFGEIVSFYKLSKIIYQFKILLTALGAPSEELNVPYIVSITDAMMYTQHTASGSILNHHYIVSNARSFSGSWHQPGHFVAVANIPRTWDRSDDWYPIESYVIHPEFNEDTGENDIAVLRTQATMNFHARVQPIPLSVLLLDGQDVLFAGFGLVEDNPITHVPLTRAEFETISNEECGRRLGSQSVMLFDTKACVLPKDNRIICNYDNGAPLTIDNRLVGISSWSIQCEPNYPIVVERISAHMDFILRHT